MFRIIQRILLQLGSNEQLVNKLAESKPIRRAAQLTAYTYIKVADAAKKQMIEFEKQGGMEKLKDITKKDFSTGVKTAKEMASYGFPQAFRRFIQDLRRNMRR